ncbi:MAG TPA: hypothetical protein DEA08_33625, partial [Planctomycetes bacterium]|nr:hypothetical protein [Planctomycetota bacterium]
MQPLDSFPESGPDTWLARRLHAAGVLDLGLLRECLGEVRARRERGQPGNLAGLLVERRLLTPGSLDLLQDKAPPAPEVPRRIGAYECLRELGRGGMGVVYEVRRRDTGQRFALKALAGSPDEEERERFRREVAVLRSLEHPHVVGVHAFEVEARCPWFVQDLLPGGSLSERLRQGPLPWQDVVELAIPLAEALAHVHERGVLHRDVKPANVLFDEEGRPVLTDFGLGRRDLSRSLTQSGDILGTPSYMAPEQVTGARHAGPAADQYGLAALIFSAIAGEPPHGRGSLLVLLERVVHEPAPALRSRVPEVPAGLDAALARALSKRPEDRYPNLRAFAHALAQSQHVPRGGRLPAALALSAVLGAVVLWGAWAAGRGSAESAPVEEESSPAPSSSSSSPARALNEHPPEWTPLGVEEPQLSPQVAWPTPETLSPRLAFTRTDSASLVLGEGAAPLEGGRVQLEVDPRAGDVRALQPGQALSHGHTGFGRPIDAGQGHQLACPDDAGYFSLALGRVRWRDLHLEARLSYVPDGSSQVWLYLTPEVRLGFLLREGKLLVGEEDYAFPQGPGIPFTVSFAAKGPQVEVEVEGRPYTYSRAAGAA